MNLDIVPFGLNYWMLIVIFLTIGIIIMYIWIKRDSIKINFKNIFRFIGLFTTFVVIVFMLEDGRVFHDPESYIQYVYLQLNSIKSVLL